MPPISDSPLGSLEQPAPNKLHTFATLAVFAVAVALVGWATLESLLLPITAQELHNTSWLNGYATVSFASTVVRYMALPFIFLAVCRSVAIGNLFPATVGLLVGTAMLTGLSEESFVRANIASGNAKIGCFSYQAKECLDMLKVPSKDAPSMYTDSTRSVHAPWYAQAVPALTNASMAVPFFSPFHYGLSTGQVKQKMDAQRRELAAFQKSQLSKAGGIKH